jgi:hypothetical protein
MGQPQSLIFANFYYYSTVCVLNGVGRSSNHSKVWLVWIRERRRSGLCGWWKERPWQWQSQSHDAYGVDPTLYWYYGEHMCELKSDLSSEEARRKLGKVNSGRAFPPPPQRLSFLALHAM